MTSAAANSLKTALARCPGCGEQTCLMALHGERGGPLLCPLCIGKWNGEHGKRRRLGRIVIRAMTAYLSNGGRDLDKLQQTALRSLLVGLQTTRSPIRLAISPGQRRTPATPSN
jgi:hypothetical protein